jgi:cobalt-zinc-cadmium efflux system outer membrane protein
LKQLLNYSYNTYLSVQDITPANSALPPFEQVLSSAEKNRPDLMLANTEVKYQAQNLKLQKSTAVPDLNLGINYTRRSSYVLNYYGIGATMDLPVFNRNQGNIKMARYQLEEAKVNDTITSNEVKNEIANSYVTLYKIKARLDGIDKTKNDKDIEQLVTNGVTNYQKKYISQLEFLDQLRAYKDAKFGMIDLNSDYFKAIQYLNFTAGTTILK